MKPADDPLSNRQDSPTPADEEGMSRLLRARGRTTPPTPAPGPEDGAVSLRDPSVVELVWMEELREHLRAPGADLRSVGYLSSLFDAYCRAWHRAPAAERWDPDYLVSALGVSLGDVLVRRCTSSRWQVVADEPRTTAAVRDDLFRRTFFPVDAVARRWLTAELGWMPDFVASTGALLQRGALRRLAAEQG